jgi:Family of unknown function (DUF5825)
LSDTRSDTKHAAGPWPSPAEPTHPGEPAEAVVVSEHVDFDIPSERTAQFVQFLREAAAHGVAVRWTGRCSDPAVARAITHLPPPEAPLCDGDEAMWSAWCATYKLGLLYRRTGPGFLVIQDRRPYRAKPARIVVGDARLIAALDACRSATDFAAAGLEKAVRHLRAADLVAVFGETAITLPYQLPAWPVPAYSV